MNTTIARMGWLAVAALAWSGTASAGFVTNCPGTVATTDREFTIDISAAGATCLASGTGNLNGNGDPINALGYVTLDKSDDADTGVFPNAISIISGSGVAGLAGEFSFSAPGYQNFVVAFKTGQGGLDPDWAAFTLPGGVFTVKWSISGAQALSHFNLYGQACVPGAPCDDGGAEVPLPAAAWLLLSGMAGLFGFGRRRRMS